MNAIDLGDRQAIFGQIRAPAGASLILQWPGARRVPIPVGLGGFFLIEVPLLPARSVPGPVLGTLQILGGDGHAIDRRDFLGHTSAIDAES